MSNLEEEKQNYLRENILDKGYEAEDFVSYLIQKKGDEGVDLSNWSLNELKLVVQEYIFAHPRNENIQTQNQNLNNMQFPQQTQPNFQQNVNPIQTSNQFTFQSPINNNNQINNNTDMNMNLGINKVINSISQNNNNMNMNNDGSDGNYSAYNQGNQDNGIYNEQYESNADIYGITNLETITCSVIEKSEMSKYENVQIEMSLGEKITGKFLTKSYFTFIVRTLPLNFNVHRRYSDFEWLRQVLLKLYSANVIPPIPKKNKIGGVRFDELFLLKRKRYLEKFLISLLNDPVIRVSQVLYDFLSIEDDNLFVYKKKAYSNYKIPTNVSEFKSPDGKIDITINEEREINYQNIKNNTEINQELLTKFNKNLKMLNSQLTSVFNTMDEISKNCEDLFMNSFKYYDLDNMKISYYQLKDMFKNWSMALKKQSCVINVNIREYFKYIKNSYRSMREMINIVENHKQNYYKLKRNLITKKEELFKKSDVSKWELGPNKDINIVNLLKDKNIALPKILYNETIAVNNLKQLYGYYLNRAISEFERIKILNGFGYKQNVTDNAKIGITILSELFKNISDIAVSSPKYDIKNIQKEFEQNDFIEPNQNKK